MIWTPTRDVLLNGQRLKSSQAELEDGHLTVLFGKEPAGQNGKMIWHLSMSHRSSHLTDDAGHPLPGRLPTWAEIHEARYRFLPNEIYAAILLPPKEEYVNLHPTTMHLYEVEG